MSVSPFLLVPKSEWVAHNELAFALRDHDPVSPGHTLVIPWRPVESWFEATRDERDAIMRLIDEVKASLDRELAPDGYNIGFNAGAAAGQTVLHLHVHVIPRFHGDVDDPRGGVRRVIPEPRKARVALDVQARRAPEGRAGPFTRSDRVHGHPPRTAPPRAALSTMPNAVQRPSSAAPPLLSGFVCTVTWNQRDPMLKLPAERAQLPHGEVEVTLPDGVVLQFRFASQFVIVARPPGTPVNALPELLRRWFGPTAGRPGTAFQVRFHHGPDGLRAEPVGSDLPGSDPRPGASRPQLPAPPVGVTLAEHELASTFGVGALAPWSGRYAGQLFVFIDRSGMLPVPHAVRFGGAPKSADETAYVLARHGETYRYLGLGRWDEAAQLWQIPDVDFATWRAWGDGTEGSRRLAPGFLERAQAIVERVLARPPQAREIRQADGRAARIAGRAPRGGVKIVGVDGAFSERTVSLLDLAWALVAADEAKACGGQLDDARVNRLRWLEGTPKGTSVWSDTGWAIAIVQSCPGERGAPYGRDRA